MALKSTKKVSVCYFANTDGEKFKWQAAQKKSDVQILLEKNLVKKQHKLSLVVENENLKT